MNYKVVKNTRMPDVLLFKDETGDGNPMVVIKAWGLWNREYKENSIDGYVCQEDILFDNLVSQESFIKDYSPESALKWLKDQSLS